MNIAWDMLSPAQRRYVRANEASPESQIRGFRFEGWDEAHRPVFSAETRFDQRQRETWALTRAADVTDPKGEVRQ